MIEVKHAARRCGRHRVFRRDAARITLINMTNKSAVTVPKSVRDYLGLKPGMAVTFERLSTGEVLLRPAENMRTGSGAPKNRTDHCFEERGTP